jgi:tetratricopeptide (TPR) repeat protein
METVAGVLDFLVRSGDPESFPANLVRAGVASSIVAGAGGDPVLELLDAAGDRGWPLHEAWGLATPANQLEIPLLEVAGDASLLGAEEVAIRVLEAAVDLDPREPIALNNLGYALLEVGRYEEAATHIETSLEIDPGNPSTSDSMGWLRYANGAHDPQDEDGALAWIKKSIMARSRNGRQISSEILLHLGDAAWRAGRQAEAVQAWTAIIESGSDGISDRRLAALDSYQIGIWGGVLVPSQELEARLEGRYLEAARGRLESVAAGEDPSTTPTRAERESDPAAHESRG